MLDVVWFTLESSLSFSSLDTSASELYLDELLIPGSLSLELLLCSPSFSLTADIPGNRNLFEE